MCRATCVEMASARTSYSFPYCPDVTKYEKLTKVGQGTFGEVTKARDKATGKLVALKKIRMENEKDGFPMTALREIRILKLLKHENVVNLVEICRSKPSPYNRDKGTIFLVLEFCEHDLAGLLSDHQIRFPLGEIKKLLCQLFNGLYFIHQNKVLHRDMKASNILITKDGVLKLADFGLARMFSPAKSQRFTNRVVTLWYRPPEILLGDRHYGPAIDLWGAGCVMAEMWTRSPILQGSTEQHQLELISILCGSISPEVWPGVETLELFTKMKLPEKQSRKVKDRLRHHVKDHHAVDLLERLLTLDPKKRIDCDGALNHDFFWTDPMPSDPRNTLKHLQTSHFEILAPRPRAGPAPPPQPATHLTSQVSSAVHDRVY